MKTEVMIELLDQALSNVKEVRDEGWNRGLEYMADIAQGIVQHIYEFRQNMVRIHQRELEHDYPREVPDDLVKQITEWECDEWYQE